MTDPTDADEKAASDFTAEYHPLHIPTSGMACGVCGALRVAFLAGAAHGRAQGIVKGMQEAAKMIPTNWLDPMLTGPGRGVEGILLAIYNNILHEITRREGGRRE